MKQYRNDSISPLPLNPSSAALVIVDVQPEYWSQCPAVQKDFPHFPSKIASLIDHCRSQKMKCIWVRADYSFEHSPWLYQFSRLHQGRIPPVVKPSSKWEDFATPLPHEQVVTKRSWSATSGTNLIQVLHDSNIDTVLVCGLITSVCVQHSAFGIFEAGFRTVLVTDACADRGMARHEAALLLYGNYMYESRTSESIIKYLQEEEECCRSSSIIMVDKYPTPAVQQQYYPVSKVTSCDDDRQTLNTSSSSTASLSSLESLATIGDQPSTANFHYNYGGLLLGR